MFEISRRSRDPYARSLPSVRASEIRPNRRGWIDGPEATELWRRGLAAYTQELERHRANRIEQAEEHAIYDNDQYSEDVKRILSDRGQDPVVYNVTATTIDWILGTEKQARTDFRILPRNKEFGQHAKLKTDALKYLSDVNGLRFHRSAAFKDAVIGGVGWIEDSVSDDSEAELIESGHETWRNMHWDSMGRRPDMKDWRYQFRSKWTDIDLACHWFPKSQGVLEQACSTFSEFGTFDMIYGDDEMDAQENAGQMVSPTVSEAGYNRERLRLIEMWFRRPVPNLQKIKGGQFNGEVYDPFSRGHQADMENGVAEIVTRPGLQMYCMILTSAGPLWIGRSPYRHNRFPLTPIWCFRRDEDCMPYGYVRRLKGIQRKINMSATKELAILSTNKVIMDEGALGEDTDIEEFREEVARPNAIIVKKQGKELILDADRNLAPAFADMFSRDVEMIQKTGGVTDENRGLKTNATSGIAIERRQNQGMLATAGVFDNFLFSRLMQGEVQLSLVEQYMDQPTEIPVVNSRGVAAWTVLNSGAETDDITRSKARFIISEDDFRASVRQASADQLIRIIETVGPVLPQVIPAVLDFAFENMDIPNRDEIVGRVRKLFGLSDPEAEQLTPEEQARMAREGEAEKRQIAMEEAEIADKQASAAQRQATAGKADAQVAREKVGTQGEAMQTALAAVSAPAVVPVADKVLHEAGFKGRSEQEDEAAATAVMEQLAAEAAAQQPQQPAEPAANTQPPDQLPPPAIGDN